MIFLCPFLHCKELRTAMYKRYINSIIISYYYFCSHVNDSLDPTKNAFYCVQLDPSREDPNQSWLSPSFESQIPISFIFTSSLSSEKKFLRYATGALSLLIDAHDMERCDSPDFVGKTCKSRKI